jgi:hypothetical protein
MLMTNATTDYDGSGAAATATGSIQVTFSGSTASNKAWPTLTCYSRSDTADYVSVYSRSAPGRFRINLASGDNYYFMVTNVGASDSIDLSVVDV